MAPALAAAHVGHQIEHSASFMGFLVGAAIGLAVGAAIVAATVATGGAALVVVAAVGGAVASTGGGALAGMSIGETVTNPKGPIASGSFNVFYGPARIPAARAIIDTVLCKDHGPKFLATGSDSVFINQFPAVRDDDQTECAGIVGSDFDNIFIGAETTQYLDIASEVPDWMVSAAKVMVVVGTAVSLAFGAAAAISAAGICGMINFAGTTIGSTVGSSVLAPLGGMIGDYFGGETGRRVGETLFGFLGGSLGGKLGNRTSTGHPVDVATGELFTTQTDFVITGLLPIIWERFWISSSTHDGALGAKWHHPLDVAMAQGDDCTILRLEHGRLILLPQLEVGQSFYHRGENLLAIRTADTGWTIRTREGLLYRMEADPTGRTWLRLARVEDDNANCVTLQYDDRGNISRVTGADGIVYLFSSNEKNRITAIDKAAGDTRIRLVTYAYDRQGALTSATDRSTVPFSYSYRNHLLVQETRRSGLSFYFEWDDLALGVAARCTKTWGDGDIYYRELVYSPDDRQTTVTNLAGAVEIHRYDRNGLVISTTTPLGATSSSTFNRYGEAETATDQNGNTASWVHDDHGRPLVATAPDGAISRYTYASDDPHSPLFFAVARETDPLGAETLAEYDSRGNLAGYTDAVGHHVQVLRDPRGLPLNLQDADGTLARFSWTDEGRLHTQRTAKGGTTRFEYDVFGLLIRETAEGQDPIEYSHDEQDRLARIRLGDGATTTMVHDADDRLVEMRDPGGNIYRWQYRGLPDPVLRINPDGTSFAYEYDSELNLIRLTNEVGDEYRLTFDADQRLVSETGFDGRRQKYAYDADDNLIRATDGDRVHVFSRDASGRLLRRTSSDGDWASFEYDLLGRLTGAQNPARKLGFAYDARGLVLAETQDGMQTSHAYSPRGERTMTMLPDGRFIKFGYDQNGSFDRLTFGDRNILDLQRDRLGRETARNAGRLSQHTDYDPQGRIRRQLGYRDSRQNPVFGRNYSYNAAGLIDRISDLARGERQFHYDQREQLRRVTGSQSEQFSFDPAGNILMNAENVRDASVRHGRLLMQGDRHYDYDDAGNRIRLRRGHAGAHVFHYSYDAMCQLTEVSEIKGRTRRLTRFTYDPLGRRISKFHRETTMAANSPGGPDSDRTAELIREDTVWYLWNGDVLLAEGRGDAKGANDPTAVVYVFEPDGFRPAAQIRRHSVEHEGEVLVYWTDHLGTPQEITNERGELVWQVALKAWGGVDRVHTERIENNLRFQGQYHDTETGLHYNRFRHYDPAAGCYINQDPIGLAGGTALAGYVSNTIHWIDPFGLNDWNDYSAANAGRGWSPAQMAANYRKTSEYTTRHAPSVHGNSKTSTRPAVLYAMVDGDGKFQKWGITQEVANPRDRYRNTIPQDYDVLGVKTGTRSDMLALERSMTSKMPGSRNHEHWAGSNKNAPLTPHEQSVVDKAKQLGCKF